MDDSRIVLIDPVFQAFGKQCALLAIRALNEALHPTLRRSQESALRESHEGGRFHTARVKVGSGDVGSMSGSPESERTITSPNRPLEPAFPVTRTCSSNLPARTGVAKFPLYEK